MSLKLHVLTFPTVTSDGHTRHVRSKAAYSAVPDQKTNTSPDTITIVMKPLGVWENPRRWIFVLSKIGTFLTQDLDTLTAQHLLTHLEFRKPLLGNTEIQAAYQNCFLPCLLLWVFHLSVSHRQSLKFMAGWKCLVRFSNSRFKKKLFPHEQAFI